MLGRFASHYAASPVSFEIVLPDKTVSASGLPNQAFVLKSTVARVFARLEASTKARSVTLILPAISISKETCCVLSTQGLNEGSSPINHRLAFCSAFVVWAGPYQQARHVGAHYDMDPEFFLSFLDPRRLAIPRECMRIQTKRSAPQRFGNLSIASKSLSLKPAITFSKSARAGELGLSTRRSGEFVVPGSVIRRCQLTILAVGQDSSGLIGS